MIVSGPSKREVSRVKTEGTFANHRLNYPHVTRMVQKRGSYERKFSRSYGSHSQFCKHMLPQCVASLVYIKHI